MGVRSGGLEGSLFVGKHEGPKSGFWERLTRVTAYVYTSVMLSKWILNWFLVLMVSVAQCRDTGRHVQACTASQSTDWRSGQDEVLNNVLGPLRNRILSCSHAF
ncbi:Calca [Columba guinea]|nr:Calca [Columba guinea]